MAERYVIRDSRAPDVVEAVYPTVTEALRAAARSGLDIWLHADTCEAPIERGGSCPCRPFLIRRKRGR